MLVALMAVLPAKRKKDQRLPTREKQFLFGGMNKKILYISQMMYTPTQKQFIAEFDKLLQQTCLATTFDVSQSVLDGVTIVREPIQFIRQEGRTTALCECVRQLFYLRCDEPLKFALRYANLDRDSIINRYAYVSRIIFPSDLHGPIQEKLLCLYVDETVRKYKICYLLPVDTRTRDIRGAFLERCPTPLMNEASLFFRVLSKKYEDLVFNAYYTGDLGPQTVIIVSDRFDNSVDGPSGVQKYRLRHK